MALVTLAERLGHTRRATSSRDVGQQVDKSLRKLLDFERS